MKEYFTRFDFEQLLFFLVLKQHGGHFETLLNLRGSKYVDAGLWIVDWGLM